MGAGGEATRRWASRRADARAEAPQEAGGKSDLRRGTRGAFARGRRQTSYEKLHELADWKRIGLHDKYADATMSRPMTRGWLHIGIAALATCAAASERGRDALRIRHDASLLTFFLVTFVAPYWASTLLHFVPWKRRVAHDVALVLDFLGIAAGFAGQTVAWTGDRWWDVFRGTLNPDRVAAVASVGATAALAIILAVAVARRNRTPVMLHMRRVRFAITGFNMAMLGVVETRNVRRASLNLALQLVGKAFVPGYFVTCVAVDATRRGPLPLWPGVWSAHENWHVVILILHVMQFYAIAEKTHGEGFAWEWPPS